MITRINSVDGIAMLHLTGPDGQTKIQRGATLQLLQAGNGF
jgi:hypothetical protein